MPKIDSAPRSGLHDSVVTIRVSKRVMLYIVIAIGIVSWLAVLGVHEKQSHSASSNRRDDSNLVSAPTAPLAAAMTATPGIKNQISQSPRGTDVNLAKTVTMGALASYAPLQDAVEQSNAYKSPMRDEFSFILPSYSQTFRALAHSYSLNRDVKLL